MIAAERRGHGHGYRMPCESCAVQFSVFKRKRACCECERYYCSGCLRRGGGMMCAPCRALSTRPLHRSAIAHLKVRDLQCFLHRQSVSTRGCVEKEELVSLCVAHVNGSTYRRRGARPGGGGSGSGAFSSLKGFTNNINDFINNAFDLRPTPAPAPPPRPAPDAAPVPPRYPQPGGCYNSTHAHAASAPAAAAGQPPRPRSERFTTTPGGERDISVPVPAAPEPRSPSEGSVRVDTADCFEIEDLDDAGWEFVTKPAEPLPNDSEILISAADALRRDRELSESPNETRQAQARPPDSRPPASEAGNSEPSDSNTPADSRHSSDYLRYFLYVMDGQSGGSGLSASALELRSERTSSPDTASLKDELADRRPDSGPASPSARAGGAPVALEDISEPEQLDELSVKQLKVLLARNRVEFRGCVERAELVERARRLWRERAAPGADDLPIEDSCKICMAAPLECVLLECGHIAACTACSRQLAECPICRQYVVRAVRFFRS